MEERNIIQLKLDADACRYLGGKYDEEKEECTVEIRHEKISEKIKNDLRFFARGAEEVFTPSKIIMGSFITPPFSPLIDTIYSGFKKTIICNGIIKEARKNFREKEIGGLRKMQQNLKW